MKLRYAISSFPIMVFFLISLMFSTCCVGPNYAQETAIHASGPTVLPKRIAGGLANIIPTPQWMKARPGQIVVAERGTPAAALVLSDCADPKERVAAERLAERVEQISGTRLPITVKFPIKITDLAGRASIVIGSLDPNTFPLSLLAMLEQEDRDFLGRENRTQQDYVIDFLDIAGKPTVVVCGTSPVGAMYGTMSLLHTLSLAEGRVFLQRVHIRDYPDIEFRWMTSLSPQGTSESTIEWAMEHKIDVLRLQAGASKERRIELSRYARERGVKLLSLFFGDFSLKNRQTYPAGPTYRCIGVKEENEDGYCLSNQHLIDEKCRRLKKFVDENEPGCLYIHFLDIDYYDLTQEAWLRRCHECKRQWPNDRLEAPDGKAGAQAALYSELVEAINGVKHKESGYDASRDCLVIFVCAPYTRWSEPDTIWKKELTYYTTVSRRMQPASNVHFAIRENGPGRNHEKRIAELAKALAQIGHGHKVMTYYHGADRRTVLGDYPIVHQLSRNFTCAAIMAKAFQGSASVLLAGTGHPLINAEYAWNNESGGFYLDPQTQTEFGIYFRLLLADHFRSPKIHGAGGFLDRALSHMYGPSSVGQMRPLYVPEKYAEKVPAILPPQGRTWFDYCQKKRKDDDSPQMNRKWAKLFKAYETAGRQAAINITQCLSADDFNVAYREYTERLLKEVLLGRQFAKLAATEADLLANAARSSATDNETLLLRWETLVQEEGKNQEILSDGTGQERLEAFIDEMDKGLRDKLEIMGRVPVH